MTTTFSPMIAVTPSEPRRPLSRHVRGAPSASIYAKFAATFIAAALAVVTYVVAALVIQERTIEYAAQLEAQHVAEAIVGHIVEQGAMKPDIQQYVERLHATAARDVVVVDPTGHGIADVDAEDIGKPYTGGDGEVAQTLVDGLPRTFVEIEASHAAGLRQVVVAARADDGRGPIVGAVILEYSPIRESLLAATHDTLIRVAALGGLVALVVAMFGIGVARRLTRPLRELHRALERVAHGDYATRVESASTNEVGRLTAAFNDMTADLAAKHAAIVAHQEELEHRVSERTGELAASNELLHRQIEQRSWEATHDVLTGLVNRREFERIVEASLERTRDGGRPHVVACMDLDRFKVVNDTCGHGAGDELLRQLTILLQSRIRGADTFARLGGDEFGILLEGCAIADGERIAAEWLAAVEDFRFHWDGKVFTVGLSVGLCALTAERGDGETLGMADTACYWAKEQGRHRVCVYRTGDTDMAARRRETGWIARLEQALVDDRFVLFHQNYLTLGVDGDTPRQHLEVLLRMIDEEGRLVQPGSFIPAAERYNLMPAIDRWVVRKVFSEYESLVAERGGRPLTCAINLSGTSINSEGFLAFVREEAERHALPPGSICFEITETAAINNLRHASRFVQDCKAMGFLFALDDFGTGTSSFGYPKTLPVDYLKIDGGFVRNLAVDEVDRAMTETINRIGHIMGIKTIAEYAEDATIIEALRTMGVDYAQGYGVCKPIPLFPVALAEAA